MSKKPNITTIQSGYYSTTQLNANFQSIQDAFDNTLSRDGSGPNQMGAAIDANNKDILNVRNFQADELFIGGAAADISLLNQIAGFGADISAVAGITSDVVVVANNVADVTNFAGVYYGASASNPSTRKDGSPLQEGDLYWNTTTDVMFAYDGAGWAVTYAPSGDFLSTLNNLSDLTNTTDARINLGLASMATQASGSVSITGGSISGVTLTALATDLALAEGGTGASNKFDALKNLGVLDTEDNGGYSSGILIPAGPTTTRPATPDSQQLRYNTTSSTFEGYDGSVWGPISGGGEAIPAGTVVHVAMSTAPTGYLKANGAAVSRLTYATLFAAIGTTFGAGNGSTTFNLPDLRGEFIRGWDDARGVDSGRNFGSTQLDALQGHWHGIGNETYSQAGVDGGGGGGNGNVRLDGNPVTPYPFATYMASDGVNGTPRTASETRPRNIALLACIKY